MAQARSRFWPSSPSRELTLTGRTFEGVLADAVWGVFPAGFKDKFGADGDHLKTRETVPKPSRPAKTRSPGLFGLIRNNVYGLYEQARDRLFQALPRDRIRGYKKRYLEQKLPIGQIDEATLVESVLVYAE